MTICRSSLIALVGAALVAGTPASTAAQATASHTVRRGDTLWDLARQYLGDPLLWPQIYRLNTQVVEDPHWIYPGEVLNLAPGVNQAPAVPDEDTPAPVAQPVEPGVQQAPVGPRRREAPIDGTPFWERRAVAQDNGISSLESFPERPLRRGEFFSSGFLTEGDALPFGRLLGTVTPSQIRSRTGGASAMVHTTVGLQAAAGASYAPGDTLLIALLQPTYGEFGDVVVPTGLVRVTGQSGNQYVGDVITMFGPIRSGQVLLPADRFVEGPARAQVRIADGLSGRIVAGREARELKLPMNVLFIDVGRDAGVAPGDVFEVWREPAYRPNAAETIAELMAVGEIVRVRGRTATMRLIRIISPDIPPGTLVRQVAKLPS